MTTIPEQFWTRTEKTDACWLWLGRLSPDGYGETTLDGKNWRAHRLTYTALVGPIPDGLVLDHLCRVRNCVNPDHLEPVTHRANVLRGVGVAAANATRTHCQRGHELAGDNLMVEPRRDRTVGAQRRCRTCRDAFYAARRERRMAS